MANAVAMKNLDNLNNYVDEINNIVSAVITNNIGKPNYAIAKIIKSKLYAHNLFTTSYWQVQLDDVCPRCYRLTLKNESGGPTCFSVAYIRPIVLPKKDENGITVEYYLSTKKYKCVTKSALNKFIDKYKKILDDSTSTISVSEDYKNRQNEKLEICKKAQQECIDYVENIYNSINGISIEQYQNTVSELIKDYESATNAKILDERDVKYGFDSVRYKDWTDETKVNAFSTFYRKKDEYATDMIKYDFDKADYNNEINNFKRLAMRYLCQDYILRTERYKRSKLYDELPSDTSIYEMTIDEALSNLIVKGSQVGFVLKPYKDYVSRMIYSAYPWVYDIDELREKLRYAIKVAVAYGALDKQTTKDIKALGKFAKETLKVKLNVEYLEPFMYSIDVYGALLPYMTPDVIDVYVNKVEADPKSKMVHTVDIFAKKIRKEHGKTINAFLTCDDDAYEALTLAVERFNRHSKRAKITDIRKSGTDKFFILVFLPKIVMTDDWDGRKFSLITRLANEEARSIGENIIRFAYDEFELEGWSGEENS